ncbi:MULTISPECIES: site-specific tyrosine recombinase/integron integrase [unclassified Thermosipho (in: thermotogales)]|uniref:site-specific tyrosine recombinase/integron integrase n=1 Tax=unclassified Thermosipho (in: thermotogales) TaxID=2676525 RepID=UPI000987080F|nr:MULTISPECIES: site-specific tyrosine recombinase/integron integrase [unclassified Thermosipho (in: thermotogales)]MBT1248541.1 recombinase XerC [Thermosipho sp. 1244]OOC47371.1 recombinase XerC [Thermosipho sp. 1223]
MDYLENFRDYLAHVRRHSENTLKAYIKDVRKFFEFTKKNISDIERSDIESFLKALSKGQITGDSPRETTISRYISSLNSFFSYLELSGAISSNPMERIKHPRIRRKIPDFLTEDEVQKLISSFSEENKLRQKIAISLLYFAGLRISELCNLRVSDISFIPPFLRVEMGKGRKDRLVPLPDKVVPLLQKYIDTFNPKIYVFENGKKHVHPSTVFRWIKEGVKKAQIKKDVHPHTLRHSYATHLIRKGVNIKVVQELLGHTNLNTTSIYLHVADQEKFDAVRKL